MHITFANGFVEAADQLATAEAKAETCTMECAKKKEAYEKKYNVDLYLANVLLQYTWETIDYINGPPDLGDYLKKNNKNRGGIPIHQ